MENRINPTALTLSVPRQTPKREFGDVLANAMHGALSVGGALARGATTGSPAVSMAVSSVGSMAAQAMAPVAAGIVPIRTTIGQTGGGQRPVVIGGQSDSLQLLDAQRSMSEEYLQVQMAMQQESREFNAISNIIKVRHDSAKASINNIR